MDKRKLRTLTVSLKIVNAYIVTNSDVLDADELNLYKRTREELIELIAQLTTTEENL